MLSPMLVGGVDEEDFAFEAPSTVMVLSADSEEDARVTSARAEDLGVAPILSRRDENILLWKIGVAFVVDRKREAGERPARDGDLAL
jgi:hypothetical protein